MGHRPPRAKRSAIYLYPPNAPPALAALIIDFDQIIRAASYTELLAGELLRMTSDQILLQICQTAVLRIAANIAKPPELLGVR
jgi:hypothetical protein